MMTVNFLCKAIFVSIIFLGFFPDFALCQSMANAVFQEMGGEKGINLIVDDLVHIILIDDRIKDQFKDVDIDHLKKMLAIQFCELSGGPCKYQGKDMHAIHADLGVSNAQFNAVAEDLQLAMEKQGISSQTQNKLIAKLAPLQHSIVTK